MTITLKILSGKYPFSHQYRLDVVLVFPAIFGLGEFLNENENQ